MEVYQLIIFGVALFVSLITLLVLVIILWEISTSSHTRLLRAKAKILQYQKMQRDNLILNLSGMDYLDRDSLFRFLELNGISYQQSSTTTQIGLGSYIFFMVKDSVELSLPQVKMGQVIPLR